MEDPTEEATRLGRRKVSQKKGDSTQWHWIERLCNFRTKQRLIFLISNKKERWIDFGGELLGIGVQENKIWHEITQMFDM